MRHPKFHRSVITLLLLWILRSCMRLVSLFLLNLSLFWLELLTVSWWNKSTPCNRDNVFSVIYCLKNWKGYNPCWRDVVIFKLDKLDNFFFILFNQLKHCGTLRPFPFSSYVVGSGLDLFFLRCDLRSRACEMIMYVTLRHLQNEFIDLAHETLAVITSIHTIYTHAHS